MPFWTPEDTRDRVRVSLRESFPVMFGAEWEHARDMFYATFRDQHLDHVAPDAWAAEAAGGRRRLAAGRGFQQGRCLPAAEVAHLGWGAHFGPVVGAGDAAADKPDPAPIHLALQQLGQTAEPSVWYMGDTALDMQAARAAGVTAVLIGDAGHDGGIEHAAPDIHFPICP